MKQYKEISDTSLVDDAHCIECGEMVVMQCNNTQLTKFEHDDWFCYCANKECPNHEGEGFFQAYPDWMVFE